VVKLPENPPPVEVPYIQSWSSNPVIAEYNRSYFGGDQLGWTERMIEDWAHGW